MEMLVDYVSGYIYTANQTKIASLVKDLKDRYSSDIVVGRDNFYNTNVWFVYDIKQPKGISRLDLEKKVEKMLK